jgi:hypothetical protein
MMPRVRLRSSTLRSADYDRDARTMQLEFTSGEVYRYFEVPEERFRSLVGADSAGRYFASHIRDAFRYERV